MTAQIKRASNLLQHLTSFTPQKVTIGEYIALRLREIGLSDYFVVPGDYNLVLLDEILKNKELNMISCCNELNAGYAADGYARIKGAAAVFVTFFVGGLSLVNAIAGAFSDDLPIIVVSGGPNSNDFGTNRILHHTLGISDKSQQCEVYKRVTVDTAIITNAIDAPGLIDRVISNAMRSKKPVYIEVCCNIAQHLVNKPVPMFFKRIPASNPLGLTHAVEATVHMWNEAVKPVIIGGVKLRQSEAISVFRKMAEALGGAVAVMPNAKGFFPEDHEQFIGTYWGNVSSSSVCETVESSDLYIYVGPIFNDYTTTGYSTLVKREKMIEIFPDRVKTPFAEFGCVYMAQFLEELANAPGIKKNTKSLEMFKRIYEKPPTPVPHPPTEPLSTKVLVRSIQTCLLPDSAVLVETGDSWFNGQKLNLPRGVPYEFQMQYGSIGWSVGALLGLSLALKNTRRCIALIGDGSFQMTAQEVSTMIRYNLNPIIFLLNNRGYTIEVEIHDGPYNNIKNWNYTAFVDALADGEGKVKTFRCDTVGQLEEGIRFALANVPYLVFLECTLDRDDCSKELLEWGTRVASANGRPAQVEGNY